MTFKEARNVAQQVGELAVEHATSAVYSDEAGKASRTLECGFALLEELERLGFVLKYPDPIKERAAQ